MRFVAAEIRRLVNDDVHGERAVFFDRGCIDADGLDDGAALAAGVRCAVEAQRAFVISAADDRADAAILVENDRSALRKFAVRRAGIQRFVGKDRLARGLQVGIERRKNAVSAAVKIAKIDPEDLAGFVKRPIDQPSMPASAVLLGDGKRRVFGAHGFLRVDKIVLRHDV